MALAETARLLASLELQDKFSKPLKGAEASLGKFESRLGKTKAIAKGAFLGVAAGVAAVGVAATYGLTRAIGQGLDDLATLESAVTSVDGAIAQLGLTGKVTGAQVADWANQIETDIGAAFDDKAITRASATLIRFGHVTPDNLRPAMVVMTDLAAKTGDVDSAATLLAKALADPATAAGKLSRAGVVLTKTEQDQVKALVKAGKTADAQRYILDRLSASTKGAAAATQGPYQRALSTLSDVAEDARKALAIGFLPVIQKVADRLSKALADPKVIKDIEAFGRSLAKAADEAVDFLTSVDWKAIGDGLKTAAGWAKSLFDAFRSLPPEVQATLVALAGLNKLSGGAVTSLVSELGKGLIKGVLGITAGVVNVFAKGVNQPGAPGTPTGGPGGKTPTAPTPKGGAPRDIIKPGGGGGFDIAGALKVLGAGLALALTVKGDTPQTVKPDATFIRELERMAAAGRGNELVNATETVNQALGRLKAQVGDGDRNIAAIGRDQAAKVAAQKATTDRLLLSSQSQRGLLQSINAKDFSPDVRVSIPVTVNSNISIRDFSRASAQYQAVAKTTFRGQ